MTTNPDIDTLREMLKRDQEIFHAQSKRLMEIQRSSPEEITSADKNSLHNWDKSIVKDCNRQLLLLEEIEHPTAEEREIMQELNKLISLGDHIMERRNLVQAELFEKIGVHKKLTNIKAKAANAAGTSKPHAGASSPATAERKIGDKDKEDSVHSSVSTAPKRGASSLSERSEQPQTARQSNHEYDLGTFNEVDSEVPFDPKALYAVIKVKPDAPLNDVKKAAKKATVLLHPDRNLGDPDAASRFANLQAACQVFESEETRREFDETGDVKGIEDLSARLKPLVVKD